MGLTSLQVCMDSSDWLQGTIHEDSSGMDSSSPSNDMLTCSRPLMERRLRPQHDQSLKCPRCDSTHTKFCYYNNYSLSQPRYFCKTCRRYWTKGGTLRNIPVGGGCRKNKKVASSSSSASNKNNHNNKPNDNNSNNISSPSSSSLVVVNNQNHNINHHNLNLHHHHVGPTDLQLSFPEQVQFSHLSNFHVNPNGNGFFESPRPIDFMESKLEAMVGNPSRINNYDFMGGTSTTNGTVDLGMVGGVGLGVGTTLGGGTGPSQGVLEPNNINFHGLCSPPHHHPFGTIDGNGATFMDTCQRLMLPYDPNHHDHDMDPSGPIDVKPNTKLLSLDWQDQGCSDAGKEFGYLNSLGSWSGVMNNYGPSSTNPPLV